MADTARTKTPASQTAPTSSADEWTRAVGGLLEATDAAGRERALARFTARVSATLPGLARHRTSLVSFLRSAGLADALAEDLAGEPRVIVDEVELPRFDDADIVAESGLRGRVRARVLDTDLLTAPAVSRLLGSDSKNPRQYANRLRLSGRLLGVPHRNQYLYPLFQIDTASGTLREAVGRVNVLLCAAEDPWGVASWWLSPNGRLGGATPADLLGDPDRETDLVELARALAEDDAA